MKKIKRLTAAFIVFTVFVLALPQAISQTPPPPNNGTTGSGGETPVGGGANIGGGILILLTMGLSYGYIKIKT